jgi:hypothetical protein
MLALLSESQWPLFLGYAAGKLIGFWGAGSVDVEVGLL